MKKAILFLFFATIIFNTFAQTRRVPIYLFKDRYTNELQKTHLYNYENIKIIGASSIYRSYSEPIDLVRYEAKLLDLIPDKDDNSILCIDIENYQYDDIKKGSSIKRRSATLAFIRLLKLTKKLRPNLQIGLYSIPFNFYYDSQNEVNSSSKFDQLLDYVDVLFPSLYVYYPATQKGVSSNLEYFKKNLDVSFKYSNKKIYPFFWYLVHPSNKRYGYSLLSKEEVNMYIEYLNNYRFLGRSVAGVVWWDTETPYRNKLIKNNQLSMDDVLIKYLVQ